MNQETRHNTFEGGLNDKEVLRDIQQARSALASLWHKETNLTELREKLSFQDQQYQEELLAHGYEMTALLRLYQKEIPKKSRDIHHLRVISGDTAKLAAIEEALEGKKLKVSGAAGKNLDDEEQKEHESLRRMIQEHKAQMRGEDVIPSIRTYTSDLYAIDVAEHKARTAADTYPRDAIFASDVVVLFGEDILEKPKDENEAQAMLAKIAGKEVRISSGSVLIATIRSGETILMRRGVVMRIKLKEYSQEDIVRYLREREGYQSVSGAIDYASPAAQRLIASESIQIERLSVKRRGTTGKRVYVDPILLTQMRDYCIGAPKEMVQEMVRQASNLS